MTEKLQNDTIYISLHSSIQHPGQEKESYKLQTIGSYVNRNGSVYLRYKEEQEGELIQSTIKVGKEEALIMRSGAVQMRLPFSIHQVRLGEYHYEQMTLPLQVKTKSLSFIQQSEKNGQFHVAYELHAEDSLLGIYELSITYSEGQL